MLSGHEAKLSDEDDYYNLRLGSADTYAQSEETYQIRYQVHTRDLRLGDIQSFYWNLISVNWGYNNRESHLPGNDAEKL